MNQQTISSANLHPGPVINSKFDAPLPMPPNIRPRPYQKHLTPLHSELRPHCAAKDRITKWVPLGSRSHLSPEATALNLQQQDIERIKSVTINGWSSNTLETYGSGILAFHVFCDLKNVPEEQRAPAPELLITSFLAAMAASYSPTALRNYLSGVRAWHILHGLPWSINDDQTDLIIKAAYSLTPQSSRKEKRPPMTVAYIVQILAHLDPSNPLHAAIAACLTTSFYASARLGEFTVRTLKSFDPNIHVKRSNIRIEHDRQGLQQTTFFIPRTKTALEGEDVYWATQSGPSDPHVALANHFAINDPPHDIALFSYIHTIQSKTSHRPLTKTKFIQTLNLAATQANLPPSKGHAIRIGATLEYLLRQVPLDVVKVKGRWASEAFIQYLRDHAQVMAPFMQAIPDLQEQILRFTLPTARR